MASPTLGSIFSVSGDAVNTATVTETSSVKEEAKQDVSAQQATEQKDTTKVEEKATEKVESKADTKASSEASKKEPDKTTETKAETEKVEKKADEKPATNWEDESNPYLKRHRDTAAWANKTHQENLALAKRVREIENEQRVAAGLEPVVEAQPAPEDVIAIGEQVGKARSSLVAAYDSIGKEKVDAELNEFNAKFENNAIIQARVLNSPQPVVEALRVLKEFRFTQKYGNDTDKIVTNLKAEWMAEELPKLREQVTKEIMERVNKEKAEGKGIGGVREAGKGSDAAGYKPKTLAGIFGH